MHLVTKIRFRYSHYRKDFAFSAELHRHDDLKTFSLLNVKREPKPINILPPHGVYDERGQQLLLTTYGWGHVFRYSDPDYNIPTTMPIDDIQFEDQ